MSKDQQYLEQIHGYNTRYYDEMQEIKIQIIIHSEDQALERKVYSQIVENFQREWSSVSNQGSDVHFGYCLIDEV